MPCSYDSRPHRPRQHQVVVVVLVLLLLDVYILSFSLSIAYTLPLDGVGREGGVYRRLVTNLLLKRGFYMLYQMRIRHCVKLNLFNIICVIPFPPFPFFLLLLYSIHRATEHVPIR